MVIDQISNAHLYTVLGSKIKRAFDYLRQTDLTALDAGKYELDGEGLYVIVQQYSTKPVDLGKWEAHRRYIDLQYVIKGTERIGYAPLSRLVQGVYDEAKDFLSLSGAGDFLKLSKGEFMLLFPEDGHMPGLALDMPMVVKKAVVKIAI